MRSFKIDLNFIVEASGLGSSLLSSKSDTSNNAVAFSLSPEGTVTLSMYSPFGFVRKSAKVDDFESNGSLWAFQVDEGELRKIISVFANLPYTFVDYVEFTENEGKLLLTISEVHKDGKSEDFDQVSHYRMNIRTIKEKVLSTISQPFPEDEQVGTVASLILNSYFKAFLAQMSNDATGSVSSILYMSPDYIYASVNNIFTVMQNLLPKDMTDNITLSYASVQTIKKLSDLALADANGRKVEFDDDDSDEGEDDEPGTVNTFENVNLDYSMIRNEKGMLLYIAYRYGDTEVFVKPKSGSMIGHSKLTAKVFETDEDGNFVNRNLGAIVDRQYFKSVLRRPLSSDKSLTFKFTEDGLLNLDSGSFNQDIPLVNSKGDIEKVSFKISLAMIMNMFFSYDMSNSNLFMYFLPVAKGVQLVFADESSLWVTTLIAQSA